MHFLWIKLRVIRQCMRKYLIFFLITCETRMIITGNVSCQTSSSHDSKTAVIYTEKLQTNKVKCQQS